jgi:sec-independent protein translocase protein TatA
MAVASQSGTSVRPVPAREDTTVGFLREPSHLLLILVVVVVLFGSRRLPDAARGLGRSMRIFKSEVKQMKDDDAPRPGETRAAGEPPLEGRVVRDDDPIRTEPRADEVRRDA